MTVLQQQEEVVLRRLIERNAELFPDREIFSFESGEVWTARIALMWARSAADTLRKLGIGREDVVSLLLPNGPEFLAAWWGTHLLGAVFAPINIAFKGNILAHVIEIEQPKVIVTNDDLSERLLGIDHGAIVIKGEEVRDGDPDYPGSDIPATAADIHALIATSGTTGPSKVWATTMLQFFNLGLQVQAAKLTEKDRFLVDLPLFHSAAIGTVVACQAPGVPISLRERPSLSSYFDVIRETGATAAYLVGSMAAKLLAEPPSPLDRQHRLRTLVAAPLPPRITEFCERFGILQVTTGYGSTELGRVFTSDPDELPPRGSCGKRREGWDVRLVNRDAREVDLGEVGELLVQPQNAILRSGHYYGDPNATKEAWRDGWFHTGDLFREDERGYFYFVDRLKDALRRRGENISSFEVEREVTAYPGIKAVACVAAPTAEGVEDEVKVWIVPKEGVSLDLNDLVRFLSGRMPGYMVPRYYEFIDQMPTTATQRVQKNVLRTLGNGEETWDRLAEVSAAKQTS